MRIDSITLENFRGITNASVAVAGKSTILFGINGSGKTTILKAVNLLFSNIINKVVNNRFKQGIRIETIDITNGQKAASVSINFSVGQDEFSYFRTMNRSSRQRTHAKSVIENIKQAFHEEFLLNESADMPVYINYGVNRLVLDVPLRVVKKHDFDKLAAFEKAIESKIDFRTFFEWFRNQEDIQNAMKVETKDLSYTDKSLSAVKQAISSMLDDITDIRVQRRPLSMEVKREGRFYRIEQLSDGEKCTLALIGDIARRLALANPHNDNSNNGSGIVLIDEIELHMHPTWQRRILEVLSKTFPNIQFIITTHSPQVLGEAGDEYKTFSVSLDEGLFSINQLPALNGWNTNEILEGLMETRVVSIETADLVSQMFHLIDAGLYNEAENIASVLEKRSYSNNPDIINARMLIRKGRNGL